MHGTININIKHIITTLFFPIFSDNNFSDASLYIYCRPGRHHALINQVTAQVMTQYLWHAQVAILNTPNLYIMLNISTCIFRRCSVQRASTVQLHLSDILGSQFIKLSNLLVLGVNICGI